MMTAEIEEQLRIEQIRTDIARKTQEIPIIIQVPK